MNEFNLLPIYKNGIGELVDGIMIGFPMYCKCKKNDRCDKFYEKVFELGQGLYVCPYGFNTFVLENEGNVDIFSGLRVRGHYNPKKADIKVEKSDNNKIITYKELGDLIKKYNEHLILYNEHRYLKEFVNNTVHDIRKFNTHIMNKGTMIVNRTQSQSNKNLRQLEAYGRNVLAMSSYISTRLDIYNYLYNKTPFKVGEPYEFNFYKTFDKIRMCLKDEASRRNLKINIRCNGNCSDILAYDSIELLPYLIIDNALKYSFGGEKININIKDEEEFQEISIGSISIKVDEDEIDDLITRGYRGRMTKKSKQDGSGIGLYLVKEICKANDLDMKISSRAIEKKKNKETEYGYFEITILVKKNSCL